MLAYSTAFVAVAPDVECAPCLTKCLIAPSCIACCAREGANMQMWGRYKDNLQYYHGLCRKQPATAHYMPQQQTYSIPVAYRAGRTSKFPAKDSSTT